MTFRQQDFLMTEGKLVAPDDKGPAVTAHTLAHFSDGEFSMTVNRRFLLNDPWH